MKGNEGKAKRAAGRTLNPPNLSIQALLDGLMVGVCLVDADGRVTALNPEGTRILGWPLSACQGQHLHDLIQCGSSAPTTGDPSCPVREIIEGAKPVWLQQASIRCCDGSTKEVELTWATAVVFLLIVFSTMLLKISLTG